MLRFLALILNFYFADAAIRMNINDIPWELLEKQKAEALARGEPFELKFSSSEVNIGQTGRKASKDVARAIVDGKETYRLEKIVEERRCRPACVLL